MFTLRKVACLIYANAVQKISDLDDQSRDLLALELMHNRSLIRPVEQKIFRNLECIDNNDDVFFAYKYLNRSGIVIFDNRNFSTYNQYF